MSEINAAYGSESPLCDRIADVAKIGYARVSTRDQNPDGQVDALGEAGCERIFIDRASGKLARRPELDKALDYLRASDQLVVTKLDRLGRSVRHPIDLVGDLGEGHVDLCVLHHGIDTASPAGRLFFHLVGAFAEFERDLISERTREGLDAAPARGRAGGRPRRMTPHKAAIARQMYDTGEHTLAAIASTLASAERRSTATWARTPTVPRPQHQPSLRRPPRHPRRQRPDRAEGAACPAQAG